MNRYVPILQEHSKDAPLELEQLLDRGGTLILTMVDAHERRISLSFDSYMVYRKMDEGDALLTHVDLVKTGGTGKWFYRVEDSEFLAWFNKESCNVRANQNLVHYCIAALNDIVDVISLDAPVVQEAN
jgi:hypothetical protein